MASACINNGIGLNSESFVDCSSAYASYGWLSPRASCGREMPDEEEAKSKRIPSSTKEGSDPVEESDPEVSMADFCDFEFRLEDPVTMLPADELFSDGKLVPLQMQVVCQEATASTTTDVPCRVRSADPQKFRRRTDCVSGADPHLFSPKAPSCSSRWRDLLGFRKLYHGGNNNAKPDNNKTTSSASSHNGNGATLSVKNFLHRSSKPSNDSSVNLPLLKDTDNDLISVSSRQSLSSSSSGHDLDDLPRTSLDSGKPGKVNLNTNHNNPPRMRMVKTRTLSNDGSVATRGNPSPIRRPSESSASNALGVSMDSPRMNSSGKIVFHSLERSSSSPGSFTGGPRFKHRGMERSYSANVRVPPVINVPVCSLRGSYKSGGVFGLPLFSSPQKRDGSNGGNGGPTRSQPITGKNRTDRS